MWSSGKTKTCVLPAKRERRSSARRVAVALEAGPEFVRFLFAGSVPRSVAPVAPVASEASSCSSRSARVPESLTRSRRRRGGPGVAVRDRDVVSRSFVALHRGGPASTAFRDRWISHVFHSALPSSM